MPTNYVPTAHYIIVSDEGTSTKPKQHATLVEAEVELLRLTKLKPGITFRLYEFKEQAFTPKPVEQETTITKYAVYSSASGFNRGYPYPYAVRYV